MCSTRFEMGLKLDEKPIAMLARDGAPDECGAA
jgi:hypothetical protein